MSHHHLLKSPLAVRLYERCAKELPIIDYHNHLSIQDIVSDRSFSNLTQLWIAVDPYKHRAMRILGVPEHFITGQASDYEKFEKWYGCLPRLAGNPLYDWSVMEFETLFAMTLAPFRKPAQEVWQEANEKLQALTASAILEKFHIEYCAPCATICDDLAPFAALKGVYPSLRGDDMAAPTAEFAERLSAAAGMDVRDLSDYEAAMERRIGLFRESGCRFADHALDAGFDYLPDDGLNEARFQRMLARETLSAGDKLALTSRLLRTAGRLYARHGLAMQLHIGAKRTTSSRLRSIAGPAGGYAAIGSGVNVAALTAFLDDVEKGGRLPKTILFTLNPADNAIMANLSGSYSCDSVESVVCQGPAWWWCDHAQGMREMLEHLSVYSVLSTFIGMTTDSRSLLSFVRHDYFRRILCQWIAEKVDADVLPDHMDILSDLIRRMCYENAKNCIV